MLHLVFGSTMTIAATVEEASRRQEVNIAARFIVYHDSRGGYRRRLRLHLGETVAASAKGHLEKSECEGEMEPWGTKYPDVCVRDATIRNVKERPLLKG
jgi:uncharacterized protein YegP (UPF0339 family)